jgi:hypothetical protein
MFMRVPGVFPIRDTSLLSRMPNSRFSQCLCGLSPLSRIKGRGMEEKGTQRAIIERRSTCS